MNQLLSNNSNNNEDVKFSGILKATLMYYHTTLRNVGLYTSISIALFTFSKFFADTHRYNTKFIRIIIRLLSIFLLSVACYMCFNLYLDILNLDKFNPKMLENNLIDINKWHYILIFVFIILFTLLLVCCFVFSLDIVHNRFQNKIDIMKGSMALKKKNFSISR
tara:strand:- start:5266 stop:5757 length:492 start_codon:yes stop_codon:yes gene_type:complete